MSIAVLAGYCLLPADVLCARIVTPTNNYTYNRLEQELCALARRFPHTLCVEAYGHSRERRTLYAAIAGKRDAPHAVLIQASIHGREHMTTTLVMMQLERVLRRGVPEGICFYFLPMANPDGVTISQCLRSTPAIDAMYEADKAAGYFTRDKTAYLREWKANAAGVDLNRNFDALWERVDTHITPSNADYRGPYPESEPETRALTKLTKARVYDATISYHATGSEIYYAFAQDDAVNNAGLSLARYVNRALHYEINPDSGVSFGGYKDWAIMDRKIPSLTIEVGIEKTPLAFDEWNAMWRSNASLPYAVARWVKKRCGVWY